MQDDTTPSWFETTWTGPKGLGLTSHENSLSWRAFAALILLCLCLYLPGISALPPTDRDESFFAQASKQMVETHNYVDIRFLDATRYKKPIGIYWLQAASVKLFNPDHLNEIWAYRVPSLLGATLAVLMTAALGALFFNNVIGFAAGVMMACCLDLGIEAHLAKTDAALLGSVMVAQYALARAYRLPQSGYWNAFAFWTAIGAGILLKGPIILLTLGSTLLWLRVTEKNLSWFKRLKPIEGLFYAAMLVAPWFIAINLASHGRFTEASAGKDFLAKLWQGQDRGFVPPGMHTLIFPAMFFPFSLFALLAIPDAWASRRIASVRFLLGWIIPTWIVFELSSTKLPHYVLPAYPAMALLTAKFFFDGYPLLTNSEKRWWPTLSVGLWLIIGMVLAAGFCVIPFITNGKLYPPQIIGSLALLLAQGLGMLLFLRGRKMQSVVLFALGSIVFYGIAYAATVPNLNGVWLARDILAEARRDAPCPELKIASSGFSEPSLAFLAGTSTKFTPNGTFAVSEMQHDPCRVGVINEPQLEGFLLGSSDFPTQPKPVGGEVDGLNLGHGSGIKLHFYVMPPSHEPTPQYP